MLTRDLVGQALLSLRGRSTRSVLTATGVAVGIGAVVTMATLAATSGAAITGAFDARTASTVSVVGSGPTTDFTTLSDGVVRVGSLNGIRAVGVTSLLSESSTLVGRTACASSDACGDRTVTAQLVTSDPTGPVARGATMLAGRMPRAEARGTPECALDTALGRKLGLGPETVGETAQVFAGRQSCVVVGHFEANLGDPDLTSALVLSRAGAVSFVPGAAWDPAIMTIAVEHGAARQVGREATVAADPTMSAGLQALVPPQPDGLRSSVGSQVQSMVWGLCVVALLVGALGVASTVSASVHERRAEIGLRRALGASPTVVALQFVCEAALLGLAGGLAGAVVGISVAEVVALAQQWLLVVPWPLVLAAPAGGALVGLLAGVGPALRATRFEPADAVRGLA